MDHEDQIDLILEGLLEEYKPVVDQMERRNIPSTIIDLHECLLNQEAKLISTIVFAQVSDTANVVQQCQNYPHNPNKPHYNNNHNNQEIMNKNWQPSQQNRSENRIFHPYLDRC